MKTRWTIQARSKDNPEWVNIYKDNRSYASKAYAEKVLLTHGVHGPYEVQIVKSEVITDTEMLDFMIDRFLVTNHHGTRLPVETLNVYYKNPREAIAAAMRGGK